MLLHWLGVIALRSTRRRSQLIFMIQIDARALAYRRDDKVTDAHTLAHNTKSVALTAPQAHGARALAV
eukprot:483706-Pleurochrysis_carterae.AAC.1